MKKSELDLVANYILSGNAVLVLGPNFSSGSVSISGENVPDYYSFLRKCCNNFGIRSNDFSTDQEIVDYLTRTKKHENDLRQYMKEQYGVKRVRSGISVISTIVWRRIYSFDISDSLDLVYRQNAKRRQAIKIVEPHHPISGKRESTHKLELIKLSGDGLSEISDNVFTKHNFKNTVSSSPWYRELKLDCELHPVIFLGVASDKDYLFNELRAIRRSSGHQPVIFVCPNLKTHQIEMLSHQSGIYINSDCPTFLTALAQAFPNGRSLDDIAEDTLGFTINNKELQESISGSFTALTVDRLKELSVSSDIEGGIYSFYKGESVRWNDITQGIYADLVPFKNWRNRISLNLDQGFPGSRAFLLTSPAGMGKTVGLMAVAYWLRQRTKAPILWLEPDGDLRGFLMRLRDEDFEDGLFIFVDDITQFIEAFDDIDLRKFTNISFIATSREARWQKYKSRFPEGISITVETLRKLNRTDAEELHSKIDRYGTTVHFQTKSRDEQIKEILNRSKRDMLVLIRELGQGLKFDQIIKSEVEELDRKQKFVYFTVCLSDRNQIPMPVDLLSHALSGAFPDTDLLQTFDGMGRILDQTGNRRTVKTRHAVIAHHIIEPRNSVIGRDLIKQVVLGLLHAFANYQIPIVVHHSNTGHARVFKSVINRRFLAEVLGVDVALTVYRSLEKLFELDGFFWQQYGLCQSQAGNYEDAIVTLKHALAVHEHFQIKHSLGAACLLACAKLGPSGLEESRFHELRVEGRDLLAELHTETGYKEDLAIATLVELDMDIAKQFDSNDIFRRLGEKYHRELAFYVRDYPDRLEAKSVYEKLNGLLLKSSTMSAPDYDTVLDGYSETA